MDWTGIVEKYPKSFDLLVEKAHLPKDCIEIDEDYLSYDFDDYVNIFNERDLYDFFDGQGMIVSITKDSEEINCWIVDILEKMSEKIEGHHYRQLYDGLYYVDNRRRVENYLFTRAFEILETKLNN